MDTRKFQVKTGEIWKTALGHRVQILTGRSYDIIEAAYVGGRVNGYLLMTFDPDSGTSIMGGDALVELET